MTLKRERTESVSGHDAYHMIERAQNATADFMRINATAYEIATSGLTPSGADYRSSSKASMARGYGRVAVSGYGHSGGLSLDDSHFIALVKHFGLRKGEGGWPGLNKTQQRVPGLQEAIDGAKSYYGI